MGTVAPDQGYKLDTSLQTVSVEIVGMVTTMVIINNESAIPYPIILIMIIMHSQVSVSIRVVFLCLIPLALSVPVYPGNSSSG